MRESQQVISSRADLLAAIGRQTPRAVEIDGATFLLRKISFGEAVAWQEERQKAQEAGGDDSQDAMLTMVGFALANADGSRMLGSADDARAVLASLPASTVAAIFNAAVEHSGLNKGAREAVEGNSEAAAASSS